MDAHFLGAHHEEGFEKGLRVSYYRYILVPQPILSLRFQPDLNAQIPISGHFQN